MKLLWDPDFDVGAAVDEYCRRMYGPGADTVRELVRLEIEGWEDSRWPNGVLFPKAIYEVSYPRATVEKMRELLAQARAEVAGDEEALQHLDYFSTRRDGRGGWMQLRLRAGGASVRLDSGLAGFEQILERAVGAAEGRRLELSATTAANLAILRGPEGQPTW